MAIGFVQNVGHYQLSAGGSATSHVSPQLTGTIAVGDFLAVWSSVNGTATQNTLTDGLGNTYVKIAQATNGENLALWVCYSVANGGRPTYTLTCSAAFAYWLLDVDEWSGVGTAVDKTATGTGSSSTSLSTGTTAATTSANELVLAAFGAESSNTSTTASTPTGYTARTAIQTAFSAAELYLWPFSKVVSATGTQTASTTLSAAMNFGYSLVATFAAAPPAQALHTAPVPHTAQASAAGRLRTRSTSVAPQIRGAFIGQQFSTGVATSIHPATSLSTVRGHTTARSTRVTPNTAALTAMLAAVRALHHSVTRHSHVAVSRMVPVALGTDLEPSTTLQTISPTSVINALAGLYGPVVISHRLEWRDRGFRLLGDLTPALLGGEVALDNDQAVARTCTLQLDGNALPSSWLTTPLGRFCVALWADLLVQQQTVSFCLGLFGLDRPQRTYGSGTVDVWDVQGADLTAPLAATPSNQPYAAAPGTNTLNLVKQICDAQGLRRSIPVVSAATLPVAVSWPPQTSWLRICNDLLFGLNYYPLWADAFGVLTSRPRLDPFVEPVAVVYSATAEPRMVVEPFTRGVEAQIEDNQCTVAVDDPARGPAGLFSSTRTNNDPTSPVSVVQAGAVTPLDLRGGSTPSTKAVPDRGTANAIAAQELREAAGRAQPATLLTLPDPRRGNREFYQLSIDTRELGSHWRVSKWRYTIPSQSGSSAATPPGSTGLSLGGSSGGTATPMEHDLEAAVPVLIT